MTWAKTRSSVGSFSIALETSKNNSNEAQVVPSQLSWQEQKEYAAVKIHLLNLFVKEGMFVHRCIQRKCCTRWSQNVFDAKRPLSNTVQGFCYHICEHHYFEQYILMCIGINCVALALYDPLDTEGVSTRSVVLFWVEFVLLMIFTLEITIKIVAWGVFRDRNSYLRDNLNTIDFFIVISGYPGTLFGTTVSSLTALRMFRVLRPLRYIARVEKLRVLVETLIQCVSCLLPVIALFIGVFFLFGVTGTQTFLGAMNNKCYLPVNTTGVISYVLDTSWERLCGSDNGDVHFDRDPNPNSNPYAKP